MTDLTVSQRAMIAARIANLPHGGNRRLQRQRPENVSRRTVAALMDVSTRTIADAAYVLAHGSPDLITQVERGEIKVSRAARRLSGR